MGEAALQTREQRPLGEKAQANASWETLESPSPPTRGGAATTREAAQTSPGGEGFSCRHSWAGEGLQGGNHLQERPGESGREGPRRPRWGGQVHRSG